MQASLKSVSGKNIKTVVNRPRLELIVDANVLLAGLLRKSTTRELLLDTRFLFYAPEHLLLETKNHLIKSDRFRRRVQLSQPKLIALFRSLTARITVMDETNYSSFIGRALSIAPHEEDAPYLALALYLDIALWSNDAGMTQQKKVQVITTKDLVKSYYSHI